MQFYCANLFSRADECSMGVWVGASHVLQVSIVPGKGLTKYPRAG
jgi:hypothetical protein